MQISRLFPHTEMINSICFSADENTVLTSSSDKSYCLIDIKTGVKAQRILHKDEVSGAVFICNDTLIASGGLDKDLVICRADNGNEKSRIHLDKIKSIKYSKQLDCIAVHFVSNSIGLYDSSSLRNLIKIAEKDLLLAFDISDNGNFLVTNTSLKFPKLNLWNIENSKLVKSFSGHTQERFVIRCAFGGSDNLFIASGSEDSSLIIWNINDGSIVKTLEGHTGTVNSVVWHPTNKNMIISVGDDHTIRLWYTNKMNVNIQYLTVDKSEEESDEDMIE